MRGLAWFGLGGALALVIGFLGMGTVTAHSPGSPCVWLADRDGHRLVALDKDLFVTRRQHSDWPLELEVCSDGGLWVLRAENGPASTSHRLTRLDASGVVVSELWIEPCSELDRTEGDEALVIERTALGLVRLLRVRTESSYFPLVVDPLLRTACGSHASALAGFTSGVVQRLGLDNGPALDSVQLTGPVLDLARGPVAGSAFALIEGAVQSLVYLDAALDVRWTAPLGVSAQHVASVPGEERAWLADTTLPVVQRIGPGGVSELLRSNLPLHGLDRCVPWSVGGVLVCGPGAVLRLDATGTLRPGQGGFDFLADAARIR